MSEENINGINELIDSVSLQDNVAPCDKTPKKKKYKGFSIKKRLLLSLLCSFAISFTLFFGMFEIYGANKNEFDFSFSAFAPYVVLFCSSLFIVLFLLLFLLRGRVFDIAFALFFSISVMMYIQGNFLNRGMHSLTDDDLGDSVSAFRTVSNIIIWVLFICGAICAILLIKKRKIIRITSSVVLTLIIGMQLVGFSVSALTSDVFADKALGAYSDTSETTALYNDEVPQTEAIKETVSVPLVLTEKNMFEVSSGDNIFVFIIDRYDAVFARELMTSEPSFFDKLDGFVYYDDNISLYSRTYPAATSIITGKENDFCGTSSDYFDNAYHSSEFLQDLISNNYKISIYGDDTYLYDDANELSGIADNITGNVEYKLVNRDKLSLNMIGISAYRYLPIIFKNCIDLSSSSFQGFIKLIGDEEKYTSTDYKIYNKLINDGVSVQNEKNTYFYIHLTGCHSPYKIDENGKKPSAKTTYITAQKGCFKLIYDFIDELKELDLYENATIVITGDHADPVSDHVEPETPKQTALFFKKKGDVGKFTKSDNKVSQNLLIPSLVKSSGLITSKDHTYEGSYWESDLDTREYLFIREKNKNRTSSEIIKFRITGRGDDISNWKAIDKTDIGYLYK